MSFLWDWFSDMMSWFGLVPKDAKILFLGLDNAGKTTLLHMLRDSHLGTHSPTLHPNKEEVMWGNINFSTHDLGGHQSARALWKEYFTKVDGVVYIVDANDRDRFPESKRELAQLLNDDQLQNVPFLVLGNKIDMPRAASEAELRHALGLQSTTGKELGVKGEEGQIRPHEVFMCSVVKKHGYSDGFKWLAHYLS